MRSTISILIEVTQRSLMRRHKSIEILDGRISCLVAGFSSSKTIENSLCKLKLYGEEIVPVVYFEDLTSFFT